MKQILFIYFILVIISGCTSMKEADNQRIAKEMEQSLRHELLDAWYPVTLDTIHGGFLSDFTYDWKPGTPQNKMIVTQARHVWTASNAAIFFNDNKYSKIAEHGFHFLKDKMWDRIYGGFYMMRNREGNPVGPVFSDGKTAYGNAFAIYALSDYYLVSADTSALNMARESFMWLDKYSRDPEYGGYLNQLNREGYWFRRDNMPERSFGMAGAGWKDQNSSIHLLEAFTELYKVWPDSLLRQRLLEMLELIRDTIVNEKGYLTLFLERDWTPVSYSDSSDAVRESHFYLDHVSFGHDIETAYLMLEASHVLELESETKTLETAKKMVDHSLAKGWDSENGGLYDEGYYFDDTDSISIIDEAKEWWVQAEALNSLLLMAELFPDEKKYYQAFIKQWEYINTYLIDHENGGWYSRGLDTNPEQINAPKASDWKVNYHNFRSLMNCIKMLRGEHELMKEY